MFSMSFAHALQPHQAEHTHKQEMQRQRRTHSTIKIKGKFMSIRSYEKFVPEQNVQNMQMSTSDFSKKQLQNTDPEIASNEAMGRKGISGRTFLKKRRLFVIGTSQSEKKLVRSISRSTGRNNRGVITSGQKGGGHKQKYRFINFRRNNSAADAQDSYAIQLNSSAFASNFDPRRSLSEGPVASTSNTNLETTTTNEVERDEVVYTGRGSAVDMQSQVDLSFAQNNLGFSSMGKTQAATTPHAKLVRRTGSAIPYQTAQESSNLDNGIVQKIIYDPNRNAKIALIHYSNGKKSYILHPLGLGVGSQILASPNASSTIGNSLPLQNLPLGVQVHAVELHPGKGAQIARAAGAVAQIIAKEGKYVSLRLPSGQIRLISGLCWATVGQVGNIEFSQKEIGKAGRNRWLGRRPHVRGAAKNPVDHPHGGGEGRNGVGHKHPKNPWGDCALGKKTRKKKKYSDLFIK